MPVEQSRFSFFLPVDLVKGADGETAPASSGRRIAGVASTETQDLQDEIVRADGIGTDYFLAHGFINDDHKPIYVGEPDSVTAGPKQLNMTGLLYGGRDCHATPNWSCADCRADYWWSLLNALDRARESGARRRVGFSIEGSIQRRSGPVIEKCWLKHIAITANPINTDTYASVVKSLSAQPWCDGSEDREHCHCTGCRAGAEVAKKSIHDGLTYREAVQWIVREKGWSPVAAEVVARAIFTAKAH
jgi:hypothetical protein